MPGTRNLTNQFDNTHDYNQPEVTIATVQER